MTESTELALINENNALQVLTENDGMEPHLSMVRGQVDEFLSNVSNDASTEEGREEIKKFSRKITKIKTGWEKIGKEVAAEQKKIPAKIDKARKHSKDTLDGWVKEILEPVKKWEEEEKSRVDGISDRINSIRDLSDIEFGVSSEEINQRLLSVCAISIDDSFHELQSYAETTKNDSRILITEALARAREQEAEKAELERLKKEKADRDQKDYEEKLKRDAAEKARLDAEEEANKKIALAVQKAAAEADRKQKEIDDANEVFAKAIKDSEQAKKDAEAREAAANLREEQAEERAAQRVIDEQKAKDDAEREREADVKHKGSINRSVLESLVMIQGVSEELGKRIVAKLAKGKVPHTKISY